MRLSWAREGKAQAVALKIVGILSGDFSSFQNRELKKVLPTPPDIAETKTFGSIPKN